MKQLIQAKAACSAKNKSTTESETVDPENELNAGTLSS